MWRDFWKVTLAFFIGVLILAVAWPGLPPQQAATEIHHGVTIDVLDPGLSFAAPLWKVEIARRFPDAVGVLCHGGVFIEGEWYGTALTYGHFTPMADIVRHEQALHPGATIVLLACNVNHLKLGVPGVYYATDSVWCRPDRSLMPNDVLADDGGDDDASTLDMVPSTRPATRPSSPLFPGDVWESILPKLIPLKPSMNRWEADPGVVGNVFELVKD